MAKKGKGGDVDVRALMEHARSGTNKHFKGPISAVAKDALEIPTWWASTGSLALDRLTRGFNPGGIPIGPRMGRIVHLAGDYSTGKSLILDHMFKSVQKAGGVCLCSETEATRDPHFADAIGLDLNAVEIQRPTTIEEIFAYGLDFHERIRAQNPTMPFIWGIDSLEATESGKTADTDMLQNKSWMYGGGRSQALGAALRKVVPICSRYPTTVVLLNQVRIDPTVMWGDRRYTPGGQAPHFYASLEILLRPATLGDERAEYKGSKLTVEQRKRFGLPKTEKGSITGRWIRAKIRKSKLAPTLEEEAMFFIDFEKGVSLSRGLLSRLCIEGVCEMKGDDSIKHKTKLEVFEFENEEDWWAWIKKNSGVLRERSPNKPIIAFQPEVEAEAEGE